MKPGDMVKHKNPNISEWGLYLGLRTFKNKAGGKDYTCAEVMWADRSAPNGDRVSTIQKDLIEVVNEAG